MDLVGTIERALQGIQLGIAPWVLACHAYLAIAITPVTASPIAGMIGNAGMTDATGKEIAYREQILCDESSVGGSHASNVLVVDIRMLPADGLHTSRISSAIPLPAVLTC